MLPSKISDTDFSHLIVFLRGLAKTSQNRKVRRRSFPNVFKQKTDTCRQGLGVQYT